MSISNYNDLHARLRKLNQEVDSVKSEMLTLMVRTLPHIRIIYVDVYVRDHYYTLHIKLDRYGVSYKNLYRDYIMSKLGYIGNLYGVGYVSKHETDTYIYAGFNYHGTVKLCNNLNEFFQERAGFFGENGFYLNKYYEEIKVRNMSFMELNRFRDEVVKDDNIVLVKGTFYRRKL